MAQLGRFEDGAKYYRDFLRLSPDNEMAPTVRKMVDDYDKSKRQ